MAQQINLLTPILMAPRRLFSAVAMLQGLLMLLGGGILISLTLIWQAKQTSAALEAAQLQARNERQGLQQAMAALPGGGDPTVIKQQLQQLKDANAQQEQALREWQSGLMQAGRSHADLLRLLAQTAPASVWLQELQWNGTRLQLDGRTVEPAVLQDWLNRLAEHPLLLGQQLAAVRVERQSAPFSGALRFGDERQTAATPPAGTGREQAVWAFRVVSATPAAAKKPADAPSAGSAP